LEEGSIVERDVGIRCATDRAAVSSGYGFTGEGIAYFRGGITTGEDEVMEIYGAVGNGQDTSLARGVDTREGEIEVKRFRTDDTEEAPFDGEIFGDAVGGEAGGGVIGFVIVPGLHEDGIIRSGIEDGFPEAKGIVPGGG
jgi:hypothetical protein